MFVSPYIDNLGVIRPVHWWLEQLLNGVVAMEETPPAVASMAQLPIYKGAAAIARMDDIEERRAALERIPVSIRPYVQAELKRIWLLKRNVANP